MEKSKSELETVLDQYMPRVRGYLTRLVGADEAEDLAQEAALKIALGFGASPTSWGSRWIR